MEKRQLQVLSLQTGLHVFLHMCIPGSANFFCVWNTNVSGHKRKARWSRWFLCGKTGRRLGRQKNITEKANFVTSEFRVG